MDDKGRIVKTHTKREEIEEQLTNHNRQHYTKVFKTPIYNDKIYKELQENSTRDEILLGIMPREQCNSKEVHKFLKLLKLLPGREINTRFEPITLQE